MQGILICDDSMTMRLALRRSLEAQGLPVLAEAASGEEAVKLALQLKPDLVTMDVMLPGMDGFRATQAILAQGPARIVVVSAAGEALQADLSFRALESGALDLVDKPDALGAQALADSRSLRRAALLHKVPYYTTLSGAIAAAQGIKAYLSGDLEVRALQSYFPAQ